MKKFLVKLIIVSMPFLIFLLPIVSIGFYSGELANFDRLIEQQRENPDILIGMGYNEQTPYYKLKNVNFYQPNVIALGTSRVMQIKEAYFSESFYNCGGAVSGNYDEYLNFLKNLNYTPEVILFGLDSWVFNDNWNKQVKEYPSFEKIEQIERGKVSIIKSMIRDYIDGKYKISDLQNYSRNQGMNGKILNNGFMEDGSYYYGDMYRNPEKQKDYRFKDTYQRIENGNSRFEYGDVIDEETSRKLDDLLFFCKEKEIFVICFVTPFAPSVYSKMMETGEYGYLGGVTDSCEPLFQKYGFEFYDFANVESLSITDEYFIDGFHGGEIAYAKMIDQIRKSDSVIEKYVHEEKLERILAEGYSEKIFYEPM